MGLGWEQGTGHLLRRSKCRGGKGMEQDGKGKGSVGNERGSRGPPG